MTFIKNIKQSFDHFALASRLFFFPSSRPVALQAATPGRSFFASAFWALFLLLAFGGAPELAGAEGKIAGAVEAFSKALTGPVGTAIATIGVIIVGIGALLGKVSWGMALIVAVGVGVVFGADAIVGALKR